MKRARDRYRFPWSAKAIADAVAMATIRERHPELHNIPFRTIATELFNRGLVDQLPDPATVRRMVKRELAQRVAVRS